MNARFLPAGDLAVAVEFEQAPGADLNRRLRALEASVCREITGVVETVPSFRSLLVYYDPGLIGYEAICASIGEILSRSTRGTLPASRRVELPCCYRDPALGFDLAVVAERLALSVDELIGLQTGAEYLVYFIGFAPGQPYLTGMPQRLALARLDTPRTRTPEGSVGIGGGQCCVYSVESPGGFWVLGRTPVRLYDPKAPEPVLLRPGDRVRFREIDREQFDRIAAAVRTGAFRPKVA